jgi:hypothetical protein
MKMKGKIRALQLGCLMVGIMFFSFTTQAQQQEVEVQDRGVQVQDRDVQNQSTVEQQENTGTQVEVEDRDRRVEVEVREGEPQQTTDRTTATRAEEYEHTTRERTSPGYSVARSGIKGGLNFSNMRGSGGEVSGRVGWHAGFYGQLFASEAFAIQPEIAYSTRGNSVRTNNGTVTANNDFSLHYLDIPVLAVFKLGRAVEIHAGPYWSYLIGANIDDGFDFQTRNRNNFNSWDYGLAGGLGVYIGAVQIGARYNYGLRDITRSADAIRIIGDRRASFGQIFLAFNLAPKDHSTTRTRTRETNYYND